ncbi:phosphatidate cytidylyltransferase [Caldicellulosiruptor owensensis OL]|uniref:Phosphatidate cytidylyltransferase n=1 Tax=Caldicellulosiruptor owensensis (strain ATCC 700167 / DSM 13100 / OL) TaxID=632518 RepID=E4Q3M2_CALOW|nr:phosphatidate cytidylyltransferase [Caldicellulosiruptor owensensis]ADQ05102.1 phosphatidate cytidylyltransferase [Caldicellulosiruptor owensensis OL]
MKQRIITAIWGITLVALANFLGGIWLKIFGALVAAVALYEFFNLFKIERYMLYLSIALSCIVVLSDVNIGNKMFVLFMLLFLLALIESFKNRIASQNIIYVMFSFIYIVFPILFLVLLDEFESGKRLIWLPYLICWLSDTFAYFAGLALGKRRIWSNISPKKSLEGFFGAMVGGMVAVWFYQFVFSNKNFDLQTLFVSTVEGIILSIIAHTGDLFASMLKRQQQKKDFGFILPGHGGVLDRFDSLIMVTPIIYFLAKFGLF